MELFTFNSVARFHRAMLSYYRHDPCFINNKSAILKIVCCKRGAFFNNTSQKMVGIREGREILCQCVLIKHKNFDALTLAFFEAKPGAQAAVELLKAHAEEYGKTVGAKRVVVSLDGHCDYGVGFSFGEPLPPMFGESYTPSWYCDYFQGDGYREIGFSGYWGDFAKNSQNLSRVFQWMEDRLADLTVACADFRRFKSEIARYTDLSNRIFADHWYFFKREYREDWELFSTMKPLLGPCNLIFVQKDGTDIGFLLMYPDFNELVPVGRQVGIGTLLKYKLLKKPIRNMKITEIAVLPEYRNSGAILMLLVEASKQIRLHYPHVERVTSGWILDENYASQNITQRFTDQLHRHLKAYEKPIA
ncbi:MAG: N-acetyltransferase [Phycisphaerae bacterium]|nr:N-acetyltransferase [Phycisphaerae bacterium]